MSIEERLIQDAESFKAEVEDFDEQALIARVYRTLGIASDNAPAAGHTVVAGTAGDVTAHHHESGCNAR